MDDIIISYIIPMFAVISTSVVFVLIFTSGTKRKVRTVQAEVLSKRIKRAYITRVAIARVSGMDWYEYYAAFLTEKKKTVELQLPKEIYDSIKEGDKGQLTFGKDRFVSFDKNSCYFV